MPVFTPGPEHAGKRIDVLLKTIEPSLSRAVFQRAVREGLVSVNGSSVSPSYRPREGDRIDYELPPVSEGLTAEDIPLAVLHEDNCILVLNKPSGMMVHPVRARQRGTLAGALLGYTDALSDAGGPLRPGIVHRLDKDTSGVMVIAKTNAAHEDISAQFKNRKVRKEYLVIVEGVLELDADRIDMCIIRDGKHPQKMLESTEGKPARTDYEVVDRFARHTFVKALPRTGRTHQIRLAFRSLGHPVACDPGYGGKKILTEGDLLGSPCDRILMRRQALHSSHLRFRHPETKEPVSFEAPLPEDMAEAIRIAGG